jgi:hypothetical protein
MAVASDTGFDLHWNVVPVKNLVLGHVTSCRVAAEHLSAVGWFL